MPLFHWRKLKKPVFILAPISGVTFWPFRLICKKMGADIVFLPMISADALIRNFTKTQKFIEFKKEERPIIVQLFGYDPQIMAQAALILEKKIKPDGIDINLGCPAPKIINNQSGAALLKDFKKAAKIIEAVREVYHGPLSVKLSLGYDKFNILTFCQ